MNEIKQPTTISQAAAIAREYNDQALLAPAPSPTLITSYRIVSLLTLEGLRPWSLNEGPPLPRGIFPAWKTANSPEQVNFAYVALGLPLILLPLGALAVVAAAGLLSQGTEKKKPHRQMELDNLPDLIPEIHCYVLDRKIEGDFQSKLKNLSAKVEIPGTGELQTTLVTAEEKIKEKLIDAVKAVNERIPTGEIVNHLLRKAIQYQGVWAVVKALWDILVNKKIKIHVTVPTKIPGYEAPEFIVDSFAKEFVIDLEIKVGKVYWHAKS